MYCTIGSLIFKGTTSGVFQIYHGKSHDFLWNNWIFHGKSCDFLWHIWIFHGKSHDFHWAKKIIDMIYLPERKIGRSESCEPTSPVNYKDCASRPYLSYRNLQTSVGHVVAMVRSSYSMPTRCVYHMVYIPGGHGIGDLYPTSWAYQRHRQDNIFHTAPTAGQYGIYCCPYCLKEQTISAERASSPKFLNVVQC